MTNRVWLKGYGGPFQSSDNLMTMLHVDSTLLNSNYPASLLKERILYMV